MKKIYNLSTDIEANNFSTEYKTTQILSDDTTKTVSFILLYGVSPALAIIGVVFNVFSIIVLYKHGIHKSSNILLISLAFVDISFLIGYNNFSTLLYSMHNGGNFPYSRPMATFLYVVYFAALVMDYGGGLAGLSIPMLITVERFVAVYLPLKVGQIITPFRTWTAVSGTVTFCVATVVYTCFWYKFEYVFDSTLNRSVGIVAKSDLFYRDLAGIPLFQELIISFKIPPIVTVLGCTAIIIKVKMMSRKRRKMTSSKQTKTSKTTQTLLAVCVAYLSVCTIVAVPHYLPAHLSAYKLTTENPSNMAIVIYQLMNVLYSCNSSWNFLVYVGLNKNFRDTFKEVIAQKCIKRSI